MNATYVVYAAIDSLNEQLSNERKIQKDPTTKLTCSSRELCVRCAFGGSFVLKNLSGDFA
jgi:hypothetical protein